MARVEILQEGYIRSADDGQHVGSTVGLVVSEDVVAVVDPGFVTSRQRLLHALAGMGFAPDDVTDVVFSHHHPDHTVNAALFPRAKIHDHWATYDGDLWISREAEGFHLAADLWLLQTPGHTEEDVSTVAGTDDGIVVFTHAWWTGEGPADDPYAPDRGVLRASRERLLELATLIVPGHGPAFRPGEATPR
jgi:glyoxylase-like metal-dependent hydrolase (beta-lactamase superfamily II)